MDPETRFKSLWLSHHHYNVNFQWWYIGEGAILGKIVYIKRLLDRAF